MRRVLETLPDPYLVLAPDLRILTASNAYLEATRIQRENIVGKPLEEIFSHSPAAGEASSVVSLVASLEQVRTSLQPHRLVVPDYPLRGAEAGGGLGKKYWICCHTPVLNEQGEIGYILHKLEAVAGQQPEPLTLREEHRRLNEAQAIGHIGSFEWKLGDEQVYWSDELYRINGLEPQSGSITLQMVDNWVHPDDFAALQAIKAKAFVTPGFYQLEHRIINPDGRLRFVHHRFESLADAEGKVVRVRGTLQDVTEETQARQRLGQSEALLRATEEAAQAGSYEVNLLTNTFHFSDGMYRLFGEEPQAFEPSLEWIDHRSLPEDVAPVKAILDNAVATRKPYTYQRRIYRKDGELRTLEAQGKVVCDAEGKATRLVGLVQDITQRTQAEQQVRKSKALLEATINSSMDLIQVFSAVRNRQGEIVDFVWVLNNEAAQRIYGDVIGKSLRQYNPGVVEEGIFDAFRQVVETGLPQQYEKHYVHEQFNGWFHQSLVKLNDGVASTTANITERKQAEQEVRQSKTLLQNVIDAPNIGIAVYKALRDERGEIVDFVHEYINRASINMLGGEDFTGRLFSEHGENARLQMPQLIEVIETGKSNNYIREAGFRGWQVWFAITNSPLGNDRLVHTWEDITERKQAEQEIIELKEEIAKTATDRYYSLFNTIDEGLSVLELIYDDSGKPVDMRWVETNPAFEKITGLKNVAGRLCSEFVPTEPHWLDAYDRVIKTGEPLRYENYHAGIKQWYRTHTSRIGGPESRVVANVFEDITERKQAEERQNFLLKLGEILQQFTQPNDIKAAAMRLLGEHLGVSRAQYHEVDRHGEYYSADGIGYANGLPLLELRYRIDDFGTFVNEDFAAGRPYRSDDLTIDPRVSAEEREAYAFYQIRAGAGWPLIRGEKLVAILAIHDVHPHPWTDLEMELIRETAERIWTPVERARAQEALRQSEEKYRTLFETMDEGFCIIERVATSPLDFAYVEANPAFALQSGIEGVAGKTIRQVVPDEGEEWFETYDQVLRTGEPIRFVRDLVTVGRVLELYAFPLAGVENRLAVLFNDITERKQREQRQAFLLKLSDELRSLPDAQSIREQTVRLLGEHLQADRCWISEVFEQQDFSEVGPEHIRLPDFVPMTGIYRLSDYPATMRQLTTQPIVIEDVANDARFPEAEQKLLAGLSIRALLVAPLRKGASEALWALVATMAVPRTWSESEQILLAEVAERTLTAVERAKAEAALKESEEQFRRALEEAPIPVIMHAEDGEVLQISRSWTELTGYTLEEVPTFEAWLTQAYGEGADAVRSHMEHLFEGYLRTLNIDFPVLTRHGELRHWSFSASSPGTLRDGRRFIVGMAVDITERKRAEVQQAFLLKLSDALRPLSDALEIQGVAMRVLGEQLQVDRVLYAEVDDDGETYSISANYVRGTYPKLLGRFPTSDFGAASKGLRTGQAFAVENMTSDERLSETARAAFIALDVYASIGVPLIKAGRWVANLGIQHGQTRQWTEEDVALVEETAERTWAAVERARAEEALRQSQERLQKALSIQTVGVIFFDLEGGIHDANAAFCRMSGYSREALVSGQVRWDKLTAPEYLEVTLLSKEELFTKGENTPYEKVYVRPDGSRWWGLFAGKRLSETECVEFVLDITQQKTYELQLQNFNTLLERQVFERTKELQESKDLLQSVFDTSLISLSILEAVRDEAGNIQDFRIRIANKELERETGRTDLVGKHYAQEFPGIKETGLLELMLRVMQTGKPEGMEYYYPFQGFSKWYAAMFVRLEDGLVATNLDITELKRLEAENLEMRLRQQKQLINAILEAQEEEKDRIAEALHNSLAQQLYAVRIQLERIPVADAGEAHKAQALSLLTQAIRQTRDLSHELTPRILEEFGLAEAIEDFCDKLSSNQLWIRSQTNLSRPLEKPLEVALYRISQELVNNIVKHAKASVATLTLTQHEREISLEVKDNGQGFNPRHTHDSGLGLSSIRSRVELLGGQLEVKSTPRKGARIEIRLPLA